MLSELLAKGMCFHERANSLDSLFSQRFPFLINSNSIGGHFTESIRKDGAFRQVWNSVNTLKLESLHNQFVPLSMIRELINEITYAFLSQLHKYPESKVFLNQEVGKIIINPDKTFTTYSADGRKLETSRRIILANGAEENSGELAETIGSSKKIHLSEDIICGKMGGLEEAVKNGEKIFIAGGSHSAFSSAEVLLNFFGNKLQKHQVNIVARKVLLYYETPEQALADGYTQFTERDIDLVTREVYRFPGLRNYPRQLYKDIENGRESRVNIIITPDVAGYGPFSEANQLIHAIGYAPRHIPIFNPDGVPVKYGSTSRNLLVDNTCRLLMADTYRPIEGIYCIGLGHARKRRGTEFPQVGINFFHGSDGDIILNELKDLLREELKLSMKIL
jgi:hypothetical protein